MTHLLQKGLSEPERELSALLANKTSSDANLAAWFKKFTIGTFVYVRRLKDKKQETVLADFMANRLVIFFDLFVTKKDAIGCTGIMLIIPGEIFTVLDFDPITKEGRVKKEAAYEMILDKGKVPEGTAYQVVRTEVPQSNECWKKTEMDGKWEVNKQKMALRLTNIVTCARMIAANSAPKYEIVGEYKVRPFEERFAKITVNDV